MRWPRTLAHARNELQRVLHPWRRRAALDRVRRDPVARIVVVCNGNICRSPFAERVLAKALPAVSVTSAGFIGPGRASPEAALLAAALRGVDLSAHRSQPLTSRLVWDASLILVMDAAQRRAICRRFGRSEHDVLLLGDCDPATPAARAIPDPVQQPLDAFVSCYARIESCVATLVAAMESPAGALAAS